MSVCVFVCVSVSVIIHICVLRTMYVCACVCVSYHQQWLPFDEVRATRQTPPVHSVE